jgi:uncharacterized spore protein YtfJ
MTTEQQHDGGGYGPSAVRELVERARTMMTVERVFGAPVERDGVTVIPAAAVRGGGGGGGGGGENARGEEGSGEGLGFGLTARPVGAFVVKDGGVRWEPAFDLTQIVVASVGVALAAVVTRLFVKRAEARAMIKLGKMRP